ncbi:Acg family FMN-binding oxidoreductase [Amycolatopsis thermoflava]|uniref:Acg family FMN-binding oxidoreductase n=1 Tax=Amycolatopsis thermoflava TaxID=84480 RepID=UPI003664EF5A
MSVIRSALEAAVRAPSPHNSQPWRFEVAGDRIDVLLDGDRVLQAADPDGREARLSCGAAILNLRVAIRAAGRTPVVELHSDPVRLATVRVGGPRAAGPEDQALARAVAYRRSNRRPFTERTVPPHVREALVRAAIAEGAELTLVREPGLTGELAMLLRRAERTQRADPRFQDELARWTVTEGARDDGVPLVAGGPRAEPGTQLALRRFGGGGGERPYERTPLLAVLSSHTDVPLAQVRTGQALQRVLLTATTAGVSVSFLSQAVEVPATRAGLRRLLGRPTHPQAVLRFGYGFSAPATRRRSVDQVTQHLAEAPS